eukprot:CAMPEP_0204282392 /NCGR_PEP_ID=MMETSP0468-20130131/43408_1 /ASSEMBLY_ACC=CAM_ASM_000383 /TAXON_ID=2969 /ORGANISM="Oxyrrhis marina" /LENGTH=33 /DNA_ID= /DNA_START= /DNA_END= /DNA_ORIENTATION=
MALMSRGLKIRASTTTNNMSTTSSVTYRKAPST